MTTGEVGQLRTIAIVGQGGVGKTQLAEAILFTGGVTGRLGRPDDGSAVMDFEPEEINRHISISSSFHHLTWNRHEIIIADTPGYSAFLADTFNVMRAVDGLIVVLSPGGDLKVEAEKVWGLANELKLPRIAFVTRLDREHSSLDAAIKDIEKVLDGRVALLTLPLGQEAALQGVVDLLTMKAIVTGEQGEKPRQQELSGEVKEQAEQARARLCDAVAETDDSLLEKYLETGTLEQEELLKGLRRATIEGKLVPVLCGSGARNIGVSRLLDAVVELLPSPAERQPVEGVNPSTGESVQRRADVNEPFAALVFKTVVDPFAGRLSIFRVISGKLTADSTVLNSTRQIKERVGQILRLEGKKQTPVATCIAGEIAAVAKLKETFTGDTLCDEKAPILLPTLPRMNPVISFALKPKTKTDEERASVALQKLVEEDPALETYRDPQTHDIILAGAGQLHIEVAVEKLKRKFNVDVELQAPKVPYKETIKARAEAQGKYKRQTGGRGQYGDCWLRIEPLPRGKGFEFVDAIVGGVIPRQFIPSVEKGVRNTLAEGFLAGYEIVDIKVTVFDGSHHVVDSSDIAFQIAASLGLKAALEKAKPVLLEPIMALEVSCPEENMGDVIGDLNARRGKVLGVDRRGSNQIIRALVPMAEILRYASELRSLTSGRGSFEAQFSHYEEVPAHIAEKIIKEAKEAREASGANRRAHV